MAPVPPPPGYSRPPQAPAPTVPPPPPPPGAPPGGVRGGGGDDSVEERMLHEKARKWHQCKWPTSCMADYWLTCLKCKTIDSVRSVKWDLWKRRKWPCRQNIFARFGGIDTLCY